jgi:hypothetical protein
MAGNSANLRITASVDNKASGPLKAIGQDAQRMGQSFEKSASVLRLVSGAAGEMGGSVASAAGKVSGLASIVGTGGPFGIAMAAGTALIAAASAAWKLYNADAEAAVNAMKSMDDALRRMNEGVDKQKAALAKLTDELRFFGQSSDEIAIQKGEERLAIIDEEIQRNGKLISELARKRYSQEGLSDIDAKQLEALKANNDAMRVNAENIAASNARIQERIDMQFKESEEQRRSADVARAAADARRQQEEAEEERKRRLKELEDSRFKRREDAEAKLTALVTQHAKAREEAQIHATNAVVNAEEQAARDRRDIEQRLSAAKMAMAESVAQAAIQAMGQLIIASRSGSKEQRKAAREAAITSINAALAEAAVKAIAAHAGIPAPWGQILGAAAAVAVTALAQSYNKGYAHGGTVRGGTPGRDSVPIMAMPGEMIIPVGVANELRSIAGSNGPRSSSGGFAMGGTVSSRPAEGAALHVTFNSTLPPSDLETRRAAQALRSEMMKVARRGM